MLPPGAGKTRVGIETILGALDDGSHSHAVVLSPNTAIQGQWVAAATAHGLDVGTTRDLGSTVTCLTYQSLAVFDADAEVDDDPSTPGDLDGRGGLLARLHPNGRALVDNLRATPGLVLVLDECHHLLEVWGQLLGELLLTVEGARVLGLTATPADALTSDQAELVAELFAEVVFRAGVPAVVKEGHLAPFAELAWLTTPTAHETQWLATEAARWRELTTYLCDPTFGTMPFLEWVTSRFVTPVPHTRSWVELSKAEPELADAALRLSHVGLLALPDGARMLEQHRRDPDADDWVVLLNDWVLTHVTRSDDDRDAAVLARIRAALPSVGYVLTRRGVRRGRTPVDRVLARSHAKTTAAVEIVTGELAVLGARTRLLVLCDHERASATLPTGLQGVLDAQSGSAYATLESLLAYPTTASLSPLMVTGSTVAGAPLTLLALADWVAEREPRLAGALTVEEHGPVAELTGPWTSRQWVAPITAFFGAGHCQVLVGTRGLLGEGWDAPRITGLIDLTTATTLTAVVQTRGRALRVDTHWPDKVAVNWSVVCVSEDHPKGSNDWGRLVRKHAGFHGVDATGDVVDGVSHIDAVFSPYAPPPASQFAAINARMLTRAAGRDEIRARWKIGEPYRDVVTATLRVTPAEVVGGLAPPAEVTSVPLVPAPPALVLTEDGIEVRDPSLAPPQTSHWRAGVAGLAATAGAASALATPVLGWYALAGVVGLGAGASGLWTESRARHDLLAGWVLDQASRAARPASVGQVAAAVADALCSAGLAGAGSGSVAIEVHPGGEHRCRLDASEADAQLFASALDEALAPISTPRYVVSRHTMTDPPRLPDGTRLRTRPAAMTALTRLGPDAVAWHPVPGVLATNATRAHAYVDAWTHWVGNGRLLFTQSPEGAGVLAAQQGADPFDVTTVMRRHWL